MALTPGSRLGVYEITTQIGEGGMGAVYRATDTSLGRDVAIKVLPDAFAADPDRLARFEREAKTLASLNHPHIAAIYAIEESAGVTALVMELVEGDDLSQRIARGAISLDEALPIAKQIAEALEAAHEQGIIHRDLKPANIKVRADGTVKVLDFGLAKAMEPAAGTSPNMSMSPTITSPALTQAGMILGTAAYMSPEQAKGRSVDKRSDVWAFGAVLYEMLTGTRAFAGDDVSEVLASVLAREPDWSRLPASLSPALGTYLRRCFNKNPKQRIGDVQDVRLALEGAFETAADRSPTPPRIARRWPYLLSGVALLAAGAVLGWWRSAVTPDTGPVVTFDLTLPNGMRWPASPTVAVSPDGMKIAFPTAAGANERYLLIRDIRTPGLKQLKVRTTTFGSVAWSPDSRLIVSHDNGKLITIDPNSELIQDLGPSECASVNNMSVQWPVRDRVVFTCGLQGGISEMIVPNGAVRTLTRPAGSPKDRYHAFPTLLPDGRSLLYTRRGLDRADDVGVIRDGAGQDLLLSSEAHSIYAAGFLVIPRANQLYVQVFDWATLRASGEMRPLGVPTYRSGNNDFAYAAGGGTLASLAGVPTVRSQFVTVDIHGRRLGTIGPEGDYGAFDVTPRGDRVVTNSIGASQSLWVLESESQGARRLTFDDQFDVDPVIVADGGVYFVRRNGRVGLYRISIDGGGDQQLKSEPVYSLDDVSKDGVKVVYRRGASMPAAWLAKTPGGDDRAVVQAKAPVDQVHFSPDTRWVAYNSAESDRQEVFVAPTEGVGSKWQVSTGGGAQPIWSGDGRTLYYLGLDGTMYSADVDGRGAAFKAAPSRALFKSPIDTVVSNIEQFRVTADGQRFIFKAPIANDVQPPMRVVLNWTKLVKQLQPPAPTAAP